MARALLGLEGCGMDGLLALDILVLQCLLAVVEFGDVHVEDVCCCVLKLDCVSRRFVDEEMVFW